MAILLFLCSVMFLLIGVIVGIFTAPYYMSREDRAIEDVRRMTGFIQVALVDLDRICNSITRGKGKKAEPLESRFNLLEDVHDLIRESVMVNLKSSFPKEDKDG